MNEVMKKRLIGVVILVAVGVLIPVLLSRCMGGAAEGDRGQMRVYDVQPNGEAQRSDDGAGNASGGDSSDQAASGPDMPDAVSPQSRSRSEGESAGNDDSGESFSTPPVSGNGGGQSGDNGSASNTTDNTAPDTQRSSSSASTSGSGSSQSSGQTSQRSRDTAASGGHDYGASTQGRQAASAPSASGSQGSASGLERGSVNGWVVQVGSFTEQANARDLARQLGSDYSASYTPGNVNGTTYYRVNVGPFASEAAARAAASRLQQQGRNGLVRNLP